ncbi:MAG TPA: protein translocase subunit SecF [Streptosporangiaceae bacterium]|nr:protein translocase subunit SecF [Streptosporangiaceae bacterium]
MSAIGGLGGRLYRGEVSIDFVGRKRLWYSISGVILIVGIIAVTVFGLNFSVDFKGGASFTFPQGSTSITQVRNTVTAAGGGTGLIIQSQHRIGHPPEWRVQTGKLSSSAKANIQNAISTKLHVPQSGINTTFVGPSWGSQISQKATEALIAFLIAIVIYLSIAFEWKMAVAALIALMHDIIITIGAYALLRFTVSPATIIGLLTILGYSLYDTVVVFDKVRENTAGLLGSARSTYSQAANLALNQTLVRSINTSLIALLPVAGILFVGTAVLGPGELQDLALVLFVGMLSGTYSSICIATPVLADLKEREPQYKALAKRVALRASGARSAKRGTAKPAKTGAASTGRGAVAVAPADNGGLAVIDGEDDVTSGAEGAEDAAPSAVAEPVGAAKPAQRANTGGGAARPRPPQQRRSSSAKRRPSGKKKRR